MMNKCQLPSSLIERSRRVQLQQVKPLFQQYITNAAEDYHFDVYGTVMLPVYAKNGNLLKRYQCKVLS